MAKAEDITGIDCEKSAAESAAIVLRGRFEEMARGREAALDYQTIDGVHDMRVSMRRMRNGVRDLRHVLSKDHYKHFNKQLKKMYDIVGAVRDEDVALASLGKMRAKSDSEIVKQGIDHLLQDHNENRDDARDKLTAVLTKENFDELEDDLSKMLKASLKEENDEITFREVGRKTVSDILKKFCKLSDNLDTAYDFEALHKFRIASKRLRTALQLFSCCWSPDIDDFIDQVAKMQLLLGKVHDRDGWLTDLTQRVDGRNKKILIMDGLAVKWIAGRLVKKRNKNYYAALELWKEWETSDLTGRLQELILK